MSADPTSPLASAGAGPGTPLLAGGHSGAQLVFDPHVAVALLLMLVALAIVFVVALIPVEGNGHGKR